MNDQPTTAQNIDVQPQSSEVYTPSAEKGHSKFNKFAFLAILLALAAWIVLSFSGNAALIIGVLSFLSGCFGLKSSTRTWRNTAITALVASGVLVVVVSAFLFVLYVGLNSIGG